MTRKGKGDIMWNDKDHPRDILGRFTKKEIDDMTADELKAYILESDINSGAVNGAIAPDSERGSEHAERFYEEMRHRKDDVASISMNTGISVEAIQKIKNFIFIEYHHLQDGYKSFYSNADMADSWQRMMSGRFRDVDLLLIKHELLEMEYIEAGLSQSEAHDKTNKTYNYTLEIDKIKRSNRINGLYKKHKKNNNLLSCDYYPENKKMGGSIVVDITSKKIIEHKIVMEDEAPSYSLMAKMRLLEFADKSIFPEEAFCYWY